MVGVITLGFRIGFAHIFTNLCFPIKLGAIAVVSLGFCIDPDFSISASSCCIGRRDSFSGWSGPFLAADSTGTLAAGATIEPADALALGAGEAVCANTVTEQTSPNVRAKARSCDFMEIPSKAVFQSLTIYFAES